MEKEVMFVGYKSFESKKGNKCYLLNFLPSPEFNRDKTACYCSLIDVFTNENNYNLFIDEHEIMSTVSINVDIVGDRVRYSI